MTAVSAAYDASVWSDFAVAEVGAAAALAGLLVVAASININKLLELPGMVARLAATLVLFVGVLAVGTVLLVPGLHRVVLGAVVAAIGAMQTALVLRFHGLHGVESQHRRTALQSLLVSTVATLAVAVAGTSLAADVGGGLYWLVPATVTAFAIGLLNAWVVLVEILR